MKLRIKLRNYKMNHFQHIKSQIPTFLNLSFQEYQHVFCLESLARNSREEERLPYCKFFVTQNQSVFARACFCRKYREFRLINNAWESLTSHFCALRSVVLELFIQFRLQSDTIYFSSFEWLTLGFFCLPMLPTYCNSPRKCTPVKYKARQKAGFPVVTQATLYSAIFSSG